MSSYAGIVAESGRVDEHLLAHLGSAIRLPRSSRAQLQVTNPCGAAVVSHHEDAAVVAVDGDAWLVGDLRLDDRAALLRALSSSDDPGDSALVLRAWRRWGAGFAERVSGEYSFVIWNQSARELVCVRDRFGVRPFYYATLPGGDLVFSDVLVALLAHPATNAGDLDEGAVADYLIEGVGRDAAATIFAGIRRLPPAHVLTWRHGTATLRRYWSAQSEDDGALPGDDAQRLQSALEAAVRDRVRGPSAMVFMSGGLDSTALASIAHEVRPGVAITAGTSVYRTRIADEEERYAAEAARSIGIPIRIFPLDDYAPLGALDAGLWTPEPGPLLTAAMTREIYAAAAELAPVALHGHPADALLFAELTPFFARLLRRGSVVRFARAVAQYARIMGRPPYFVFRQLLGASAPIADRELTSWLEPSFAARTAARNDAETRPSSGHALRPRSASALDSPIWSSYFEWAHPLMTGAPIAISYPYCDARVVRAALNVSPVPALVDKQVLRELLRGRVSDTIRLRRKTVLGGDPWIVEVEKRRLELGPAAAYIDRSRFLESCRGRSVSGARLRALALDYWMAQRSERVAAARRRA